MEETKSTLCSYCKNALKGSENFCPNCGQALTHMAKQLMNEKKKNNILEGFAYICKKCNNRETVELIKEIADKL